MSEMRTHITQGRKLRRVVAVALMLVMLLSVVAVMSASAAIGMFNVTVYDNVHENGEAIVKDDNTAVDGEANFSNGVSVNLKADEIFTLKDGTDISGVTRLGLTISGKSSNVTVTVGTGNGKWTRDATNSSAYYYQSTSGGIDKSTFDNLMNNVTVTCKKSSLTTSASSVKLTLQGGAVDTSAKNPKIDDENRLGRVANMTNGTTYTEVLTFFTYATATLDEDSVQVQFENKVTDQTAENPAVDGRGSATFNMYVTNVGDGSFLRLGYQVKEATETWNAANQALLSIDSHKFAKTTSWGTSKWPAEIGTVNSSTGAVSNAKPIKITVTGLDPEKEYDIRGVVVTDNDTAAYTKAVNVPRVKYVQPVISTLNIGSTAAQKGGADKEITAAIEFTNRNYDSGKGAQLKAELYFTKERVTDKVNDSSVWGSPIRTETHTFTKNDDGSYKTSWNFSYHHTLPHEDAKTSAYKLVVTDLNANSSGGYYITKYSDDTFVLDETPPSAPTVTASGLSANLTDGTAVVGGANSNVQLIISGSQDLGSGLKEYSYSMYYLESDLVDNFIMENNDLKTNATNQQILQAMAKLSGANASKICEYTPSTSLSLGSDGSSTLNISKDGFYCIRATAVDNVDRESNATVAIFRVDLTPPTAPVIALAEQADNKEDISNPNGSTAIASSKFKAYDDRVYGDSRVWVFIKTAAQAGKVVPPENYQFSINGGLVWRSITDAVNFASPAQSAYTLVGGTVNIWNSSYSATTTFEYDAAFQLSSNEINGYQTVMVRAVDNMGNTSLPSNSLSMRTTEIIRPVGTISHEGIEVAISLGNTTLETTDKIEPDLRNDIALKINEKYFGADHATNTSNPINKLYVGGKLHECTWGSDLTACASGASCPYVVNSGLGLYTPSMVNVQGVDAGVEDAAESFEWVRFDHAMYVSENVPNKGTVYFPTVVFDGGVSEQGGSTTNLLHTASSNLYDPTKSTYQAKVGNTTYTRYTAMKDYVVYTGQNAAVAATTPVTSLQEMNTSLGTSWTSGGNNAPLSGNGTHAWDTSMTADTYNALGHYTAGNTSNVARRVYHMVDMTKTDQDTSLGTLDYAEGEARMQTIHAFGYESGSSRDWMFAYNGQATRKEIFFTIDDNYISPHANDAYGFFFNTTIRQNIEGEWVVSGYLFLLGNYAAVGSTVVSIKVDRFIVRLTDVRLDWFANSRINSQGVAYAATSDDFLLSLVQNASKTSNGTMTYGSQKIELLAYAPNDGVDKTVRNYVFVTVGASAEAYVWNKKVEAEEGKTVRQKLQEQFDKDVKEIEKVVDTENEKTDPVTTDGFVKIHWKTFNNGGKYVNDNPSGSAKGVKTDHVLYVKRPVVDGKYNVGDLSGFEDTDDPTTAPHSDSNCFGFGPISMARSSGHTCSRDSLVVFSNVTLRAQKANSLSDVITQPKWGTGKVKYILNISDDSIQDLTDPIMSANVAWRIQTDSAKFISWGSLINRKTTVDFIESKIENNGTYVVSRVTSYDDDDTIHPTTGSHKGLNAPGQRSQSKQVAEYIADTYYKSYGIELGTGEKAPDKVNEQLSQGGAVYSLSNAKQMQFSVTPESYNSGTANEDFPSGRWYITYDATGYGKLRTSYARFSDAFDLKVNEPGRYQVYFAPDKTKLGANQRIPNDDTLDPATAIFNFVVSEDAYAQPVATVDDAGNITVDDFSIDPDNGVVINSSEYADFYEGNQLLTGISATRWRWELAAPYTDPVTKEQLSITLMKGNWEVHNRVKGSNGSEMNPYNKMTVASLTQKAGGLLEEAKKYVKADASMQKNGVGSVDSTSYYYTKVPDGATITLYEQVQEIATVRYMDNDGTLKYKEAGASWSPEKSANLISSSANSKPIRPASSITLSKTTIYDTADASDAVVVARNSFHGQKKELELSFTVIQGSGATAKETNLTSGGNGMTWSDSTGVVLQGTTAPTFNTTTGQTTGEWKLSKAAIARLCNNAAGSFTLKITETVKMPVGGWGDGTNEPVVDSSSRTIYYARDDRAPSMQTVTLQTGTYSAASGSWTYDDYEASNYLDMTTPKGQTGAKQIRVTVNGSFDNEGLVEGYGYSFYTYDHAHQGDMNYATYYYMNAQGKLVKAGVGENGVKNAIIRSGTNAGRGILTNQQKNVSDTEDFEIFIDENAMTFVDGTTEKEQLPTAVLNLGVFAFDNQTGNTTPSPGGTFPITGANETIRTKVENIKLAKFSPMPVAITAVNTTGQTVAKIGNDNALTGGVDQMTNPIPVANTKVSVSFSPRQDWFQVSDGNNSLPAPVRVTTSTPATVGGYASLVDQLEALGDTSGKYIKYFTDKSGEADLTNRATVDYTVEYRAPGVTGTGYTVQKQVKDAAYTTTESFNDSGYYRITASVKNGSGVASAEQQLTFTIDRDKPTTPTVTIYNDKMELYKEGEWVQGARVQVRGSTDAMDENAYYSYSINNGVDWTKRPNLNDFEFVIEETGTHYVRVKAVDTGTNEAEAPMSTVWVDRTPPKVSAPNVKVDSQSVTVFTEAIITINQTFGGTVYAMMADGSPNEEDQEVIVDPAGSSADFIIIPDAGYSVFDILLGDIAYSPDQLTPHPTIKDALVLSIPEVNNDAALRVTFDDGTAAANYMANARAASFNAVTAIHAALPALYAAEDAPVAIAAASTHNVTAYDDDPAATYTTVSLGQNVPDDDNVMVYIEVTEGYRVTELVVERAGQGTTNVPASDLKETTKNHFEYQLKNVTSDIYVTTKSEKKTPTTIVFDVDGNGTVTIDQNIQVQNDTYSFDTYVGDTIRLDVQPLDVKYEVGTLVADDGTQLTQDTAGGYYLVPVTATMKKITATFVAAGSRKGVITVLLNWNNGIHGDLSPRGTVVENSPNSPEKRLIEVAQGGNQTITLKPERGYVPANVTFTTQKGTDFEQKDTFSPDQNMNYDPQTGYYSFTLAAVTGAAEDNELSIDFINRTYKLEATTIAREIGHDDVEESGGTVAFIKDGKAITEDKVTEGSQVTIEITPDSGYRIEKVVMNGTNMGKRRSITLDYLASDCKVEVIFLKRSFGSARTTHTMTVTAVGISDAQEALHSEPYAFKLNDGNWSPFQASTSYTYHEANGAPLQPNTEYTVTVRAKDRQGNMSSPDTLIQPGESVGENARRIYTLANMPAAIDVAEADDTDNVLDKTVKMTVDPMGNPADTEYCVYYSARSDMRDRRLAVVQPQGKADNPDDLWSTLDGLGQITVYQLSPGTTYYLQVAARNHDKISTEANDQNVLNITLSPTAPPDNTLYFEEQSGPGAGINLVWDQPAGEVAGFWIYRDGTLIEVVKPEETKTFDSYSNLRADGSYVYSYAYVNSVGVVGARRTAVSKEYYEKAKAAAGKDENSPEYAALKKLSDMAVTPYTNLFKEVMTYPAFPAYFTKVYAVEGSSEDDGNMMLRIQPESGTSARSQRYLVGLHAYYSGGQKVPDGTPYGNGKTWQSASTEKYTVCNSASGASVVWGDLNINWEYRVYVKEVTSTGWTTYENGMVSDGYQSGAAISPEAKLYRRYVVNAQGYGYEYQTSDGKGGGTVSPAKGVLAEVHENWANTAAMDEYTSRANDSYTGWSSGDGIELSNRTASEGDNYIKFNKSPQVFIPKAGSGYDLDYLYGTDTTDPSKNDNEELKAYNNRYLVVEQNGGVTQVKLHVKVYDPDGAADGNLNYTVTGKLGGVTAKTTLAPSTVGADAVGRDEEHATPCELVFNVRNLATGVYEDLTLSVANGAIDVPSEEIPSGTVRLVVNQSLPTIAASNKGATYKVENGRDYGKTSNVTVTSSVSANNLDDLRKVRMILMEQEYRKAQGLGDVDALFDKVMKKTTTSDENSKIDAVAPPMQAYFQVTKDVYDTVKAQDATKVLTTEPATDLIYYWLEKEYALTNNKCSFLTRDTDGNIKVTVAPEEIGTTYPVLMVAHFGKNESTMNLRFQVMDPPSLIVETEQTWAWIETTKGEVDAYEVKAEKKYGNDSGAVWKIQDVYDEAAEHGALNNGTKHPTDLGYAMTDPAVRETATGGYEVFKLWDNKAAIQSNAVSSYIQVKTGMYDQIEKATVVMTPTKEDPSGGNKNAEPPVGDANVKVGEVSYQTKPNLPDGVRAYFRVPNLTPTTTYYMWVYYQVFDPEIKQNVWYHAQNAIAMTTDSDYQVATVGFQEASRSYEESDKEIDATGKTEVVTLSRLGDTDATDASGVKVTIAAKYYKATQYGEYEIVRDADGDPIYDASGNEQRIEITPDQPEYAWATKTVELVHTERTMEPGETNIGVSYVVRDTDDKQGHMIVQLVITEVATTKGTGINRLTSNAGVFEIFVLDDESPITSYKLGLDDVIGLTPMADDGHMVADHYDYKFTGLPDPYGSADTSSLTLAIKNTGSGELQNISVELLNSNRSGTSSDFAFATPPTLSALASPDEGVLAASERSVVKIVPADNLKDGIYEGWLKITADRVKDADAIYVHLYQVVGQATLKGNIYIGETKPETTTEHVGKATVKIYSSTSSTSSGVPLYEVETDDNGYYEIPNILNNQTYFIVVERIGCATYNGLSNRWRWTPEQANGRSQTYQFDLRAVAGDIDGNGMVNFVDRTELEKYMNHTVKEAEDARDKALAEGNTALAAEMDQLAENVRRCDLDQNGGVNSIDRMLLWSNLNKGTTSGGIYITLYTQVTPYPVIE